MLEEVIRSLRNKGTTFATAALLSISPLMSGCQDTDHAPGISEQLQASWPMWKPEDLLINSTGGTAAQYAHTVYQRPPFYKGEMPLTYTSLETINPGMISGRNRIYKHEFKDFTDYFIYNGFMLSGAVAVNNQNTMVAEARIGYAPRDDQQARMIMEEFHYKDGLLVYHCISDVDISSGHKKTELEHSGKKHKEYFFLLPNGF